MSLYRVAPNQQKCILCGCGGQEASIIAEVISPVGLLSGSETTYFFFSLYSHTVGRKRTFIHPVHKESV